MGEEVNEGAINIKQGLVFKTLGQAVELNSTRTINPDFASTALRTNELRLRCANWDSRIAETFLVNSRLMRNDQESIASALHYYEDPTTKMLSLPRGGSLNNRIQLPKQLNLNVSLGDVLENRKSVRQFTSDDLPLDYLSTILYAAAGVTHSADINLSSGEIARLKFRSAPSGGGLYPIEIAIVVNHVRGLKRAIYLYENENHVLSEWYGLSQADAVLETMAFPEEVLSAKRSSIIILLIARPWRSMRKYGSRGMRLVLMESGYISQNIHLATSALGFGSVDCSGMYDDEVNRALKLDGVHTTALHAVLIGARK